MERHFGNPSGRLLTSQNPGDMFLKKVLARMAANREATKLLSKVMPHIANEAAMLAKPTANKPS